MTSEIKPGDLVVATDACGELLRKRAVTGVVSGHKFPVVWVAREEEWDQAWREHREPECVPWPAEDVRPAEDPEAAT